jgi:hypothetical protein
MEYGKVTTEEYEDTEMVCDEALFWLQVHRERIWTAPRMIKLNFCDTGVVPFGSGIYVFHDESYF